jgi:hypothetical protein
MKRVGKIAVCLSGGLAVNAALLAADSVSPDNPYVPIVTRNVFALNPPTPVDIAQPEPPAKITPNGIMSIFGRLQVLFKVTGAPKPGKPAGDTSYILSEGQRQDDIEVTHIDEKSGIVTFNNHGLVQELPLTKTPAITMPMPGPVPTGMGFNPQPGLVGNGLSGFGNRGGRGNMGGRNNTGNSGGNMNGGGPTSNGGQPLQEATQMSPEAQIATIELNRIATQQQVDEGKMPPLPPTALTPPETKAALIP